MISTATKTYLRGRAARVKSSQERQREAEERIEALRIRVELMAFSERLQAYAATPEGRVSIEASRDKEYDEQWRVYRAIQAGWEDMI